MPPRLAAISGKMKGAVFTIADDALVIGRETAANLCLADASVSRRHSKIEKKDDGFVITDLESLHRTFVNDGPIRSRLLEHGDRVRIGDSQFLFLTHDGDVPSKSSEVTLDEAKVLTGPTVQVRLDQAVYQMARDLGALMKVSTAINAIRGLDA
jgi:pSer/pThr/pTyr-binding forkhead associated (FHA) protein